MKARCGLVLFLLVRFLSLDQVAYGQPGAGNPPNLTNLLDRMMTRAARVAQDTNAPKYTYEKHSRVDELNSREQIIQSTDKIYHVVLIQGWPFSRLIQVQGRQLTEAEIRREDRREQEFRDKISGKEIVNRKVKRELLITPELLSRYDFTVAKSDVCRGRNATILAFKPKVNNPEESFQDKIYNRISGRIWVDDEDAEISKLDVQLTEEVSLGWLGMLGSLKDCKLIMERQRMPDGVWVNTNHRILLVARKLLSTTRYRSIEESKDFHRESPSEEKHALR